MGQVATILPCGTRLHLQHGPIDLIIGADGARDPAFAAARQRFATVLDELVAELPLLRQPVGPGSPRPNGAIAKTMDHAVRPHAAQFITPMAAVAGAVGDTILGAMTAAAPLRRAYVNNGGDIAIHLDAGQTFTAAMAHPKGRDLGRLEIGAGQGIKGIATSGAAGRSLSLGVADAVTVVAGSAAQADAAATLIANAVDLPDHPGIRRQPACDLHPDSDLGNRLVTLFCPPLAQCDISRALQRGHYAAQQMRASGLIQAAALFLQGQSRLAGRITIPQNNPQTLNHRRLAHA